MVRGDWDSGKGNLRLPRGDHHHISPAGGALQERALRPSRLVFTEKKTEIQIFFGDLSLVLNVDMNSKALKDTRQPSKNQSMGWLLYLAVICKLYGWRLYTCSSTWAEMAQAWILVKGERGAQMAWKSFKLRDDGNGEPMASVGRQRWGEQRWMVVGVIGTSPTVCFRQFTFLANTSFIESEIWLN